jgi:hypothetical protein
MATLAEIRAKLQAESTKQDRSNSSRSGGDNAIFPHWNAPDNSTTELRFLPDADPNNTYFWRERAVIKMPFAGIEGETDSREVIVEFPCMEMYGEKEVCPILQEVRGLYKLEKIEAANGNLVKAKEYNDLGSKYWKKRTYIFQGFVVSSKLVEDRVPENPIRRFAISPQIFPLIPKALLDNDIPHLVTDSVNGLDFKIVKNTKGKFADYNSSGWARRERALTEAEMAAINQYGLFDLKSFLPKRPTDVEIKIGLEMLDASLKGAAFDMNRWGQYYKPKGYRNNNGPGPAVSTNDVVDEDEPVAQARPVQVVVPAKVEETEVNEAEAVAMVATAPASSNDTAASRAQDILAKIRSRNAQ